MKKLILSVLAVVVLAGAARRCPAQSDWKPVVTASFSGYDKLFSNIGMIGKLGGNPDLDKGLEMMFKLMMGGQGLVGLDTTQPWGAVLLSDGQQKFTGYGFVPVTDLKALLGFVSKELQQANPRLGKLEEQDGVYKLKIGEQAQGATNSETFVFVAQQGSWAVIAYHAEDLARASKDPAQLLGDLPSKYDLAVRCSIKNVPAPFREYILAQLQAGAQIGLEQFGDTEKEETTPQATMVRQLMQQATTMAHELDELVLGWNIDHNSQTMYVDCEITAQAGTPLAAQLAQNKTGKTQFAGLFSPTAAVHAHWIGTLNDADVAQAKVAIAGLRQQGAAEIENQNLSAEQTKSITQLCNDALDVLEKTVEAKHVDGGMQLQSKPNALTVVAAGTIVDGSKLNKIIKQLADEIQKMDPAFSENIKLDTDTCAGVRFHTVSVPVPDPSAAQFFGDTLEIVLGVGDDKVLLAAGRDAAQTLKDVLEKSKADGDKEVPPMQITLAIGALAEFAAAVAEDDNVKNQAAGLANALATTDGKDHITVITTPVANGVRVRLEVEQGLLKLLGSMGQMVAPSAPMHTPAPKE